MESHAPITLSLLRSCLTGRKPSKASNQRRKGQTKSRIIEPDRVVGICSATLLRGRSHQMNLLQHIVSTILYCGHASKRVRSSNNCMHYAVKPLNNGHLFRQFLQSEGLVYVIV